IPGVEINLDSVITNIIVFDISRTGVTSPELCRRLKDQNILAVGIDDRTMRMVTHLDASSDDIEQVLLTMKELLK
ncbi:MAG TPA: hypothetical protein VGJ02_02920, partial [Pyrinomonadaceae bacterium]